MCKWGTNVELRVPIQAELSHTGRERWAIKKIDACIAPIVDALNKGGVLTTACCCGHGKANGEIHLQDGPEVIRRHYSDQTEDKVIQIVRGK
jgi:hypothetical protein